MFTIFDSKVGTSLTPFFAQSRPAGIRQWHYNCNREESDYRRYPGDYTLFEIGVYDADKMEFVEHDTQVNHGLAQIQINREE